MGLLIYDGSKGTRLSYQLTHIAGDGSVRPMTSGIIEDRGSDLHETNISVYTINAEGKAGFKESLTVDLKSAFKSNGEVNLAANSSLGMFNLNLRKTEKQTQN